MTAVLSWLTITAPLTVLVIRELIALCRHHIRHTSIERLIQRRRRGDKMHIVNRDRDGTVIDVTVIGTSDRPAS